MRKDRLKELLDKKSKKKLVKLCKKFNISVKKDGRYIKKKDMIALLLNNKAPYIKKGGTAAGAGKAGVMVAGVAGAVGMAAVIVSVTVAYQFTKRVATPIAQKTLALTAKAAGRTVTGFGAILKDAREKKIRKKLEVAANLEKKEEKELAERIRQEERQERQEERQDHYNHELAIQRLQSPSTGGSDYPGVTLTYQDRVEQRDADAVKASSNISTLLQAADPGKLKREQDEASDQLLLEFSNSPSLSLEEKAEFVVSSYRQIKSNYALMRSTNKQIPTIHFKDKQKIKSDIITKLRNIDGLNITEFVKELDKTHNRLRSYTIINSTPHAEDWKEAAAVSEPAAESETPPATVSTSTGGAGSLAMELAALRIQRAFRRPKTNKGPRGAVAAAKKELDKLKKQRGNVVQTIMDTFGPFLVEILKIKNMAV